MLDAMGDMQPPSERIVKQTIFDDMKDMHPEFDDALLYQTIDAEFVRFGGTENLGSRAGWLIHTRAELGMNVLEAMTRQQQGSVKKDEASVDTTVVYSHSI